MDETLTLRLARRDDLASVDALLARSYPKLLANDYPPSVLVTALPIIARARPELLASGRYWLVCEAGGAVLAAGGWSPGAPADGARQAGTGHVRHLVCDHRHTRRGLARQVMEAAMMQAAGEGVRRLDCLSTRTAVPFYAALGFRALGAVEIALRPGIGFPAVRMERAL